MNRDAFLDFADGWKHTLHRLGMKEKHPNNRDGMCLFGAFTSLDHTKQADKIHTDNLKK